MNDGTRDPIGTGVALLTGTLIGVVVAAPLLPRSLPVVNVTVSPVGAALLAGSLSIVAIPLCIVFLYLVSAQLDR